MLLFCGSGALAAPIYIESFGQVVGEAELFSFRSNNGTSDNWNIVPTETPGVGEISNARGGKFVQALPDSIPNQVFGFTAGGPTGSYIEYVMRITTPGMYNLYVRWDGTDDNTTFGESDSLFADIVELKDGLGGSITDWYELTDEGLDEDFASGSTVWDFTGGIEQDQFSASDNMMAWNINTAGDYTLRFSQREDGAAVDAFVFQLSSLSAPTGNGPAISETLNGNPVPEPSTMFLLLFGLIGFEGLRRKMKKA
jgi:hypothetical protein